MSFTIHSFNITCPSFPHLSPASLSFSQSVVQCQVPVAGGSLSPDGPLWSFIDDTRTEDGLPSCCCLAPRSLCPYTHIYNKVNRHKASHSCTEGDLHRQTSWFHSFSFFFCLVTHLVARLLSTVVARCTFAPCTSPSCLKRSLFHLLLGCYWLRRTGTDRRRGGGGGRCESNGFQTLQPPNVLRITCKTGKIRGKINLALKGNMKGIHEKFVKIS